MLNGSAARLGTVADVVDKVYGRNQIQLGVVDSNVRCEWIFSGDRSEMSMVVESVTVSGRRSEKPDQLRHLLPPDRPEVASLLATRIERLTYITAERVGPREVYALEDQETTPTVGPLGEHAASVLHLGREEHVLDELALQGVPPTRLRQVEARMQELFPGCGLMLQQVPQVNAVTLGLRTSDDTDFHRPVHAGFGLTQILPIIVACLSATKGDMVLVENPEVHLHPSGQAHMGRFLTTVASAGVQLLVESHSDHVLNGIRRAVKAGEIEPSTVAIHFFNQRGTAPSQIVSPTIGLDGKLDSWPKGFFDQIDKDTNYLAGWGD
jgi:predicted ATPase